MMTGMPAASLAIDLGTSGPKVALVSTEGEILGCEFEPNSFDLLPNGGAEQCPDDWWGAIVTAARRLLEQTRFPPEKIVAVSCTGQWSGTVPVSRDGQPLMNAVIWMDARGAPYIQEICSGRVNLQGYDIAKLLTWLRYTGGMPTRAGKDPIAHILFIKNELPEIYRQTYKFLEPKDYLNLRLTGRFAATFDSISLHWLTDNRCIDRVYYHPRLLQMTGIERDKLPDLCLAQEVIGLLTAEAAGELGLASGLPVIGGTPDLHSAAIGSGAAGDYQAHLYVGSSSWIACHLPFKKTDPLHNMASVPSALPGSYLVINEQECAGLCLTYLRDSLFYPQDELSLGPCPPDSYAAFDRIAVQAPPGSGNLIFTPWLYGERTPVEDHLLRGGFFNLSLTTDRSRLVRSIFEGVAYNTRWLLSYVEKFIRRRVESLNVVGGGAKSDEWCQIFADVLDRPIRQVKDPIYANVRGAGFLAALALGYLKREQISERIQIARTYLPRAENRELYDRLFREFLHLYKIHRPVFARLNRKV
jgi:xylulokinase